MTDFLFGTVGSPKSTPPRLKGTSGAIIEISKLGLDTLEIGWVRSARVSENTCIKIKETAINNNVQLSVHAPYFINLNASDSEWIKSKKRLLDAAHYGNLAGSTDIIFHPGSYFNNNPKDIYTKIIKRLFSCVDTILNNKNSIILRPETMGKKTLIGSLDDVILLSKEIEGVKPCLDIAHLHARNNGRFRNNDEMKKILEIYAKELGDKSLSELHIHISGIIYSSMGEIKHIPLNDSDIDIKSIFKALKHFNCGGRILCESPLLEIDALYIKNLWSTI